MPRAYLDGDKGKEIAAALNAQARELLEILIGAMQQNKRRQKGQVDDSLLEAMRYVNELSGFYELWRRGELEALESQLKEQGLWPSKQLPDD